jgi:hypothetical protein
MESLSETLIQSLRIGNSHRGHRAHRASLILVLSVAQCLLFGCVHLPKTSSDDAMPHGAVCQVVATWNHQVVFAPDPVHGGAEAPGLVGRLYLFGPEISYPLIEDGSVIVDLFDDTKPATDGPPVPLEEWRIDPGTLKRLAKHDMIGWGYTLFLPWGTYRPEINQIHLKLRYASAKGTPLYSDSGRLSLDRPSMPGTAITQAKATQKAVTSSGPGPGVELTTR